MTVSDPVRAGTRRTRSTHIATLVLLSAAVLVVTQSGLFSFPGDPRPSVGATLLDATTPGVANLDPDLLRALRRAAADASRDGVELHVNSGWRSPEHQAQLLRDAISVHGSEEEAARWVATPETSVHVSGDAVDIGPRDAAAWLSDHGSDYGLCQIYDNEPWHYELRVEAVEGSCPATYADPTHDPRMQE